MPLAAAAEAPLVVGDHGKATLAQMAGGEITLPSKHRNESKTFQFRLPRGVKQGPDTWYTIHLDVAATFVPGTGPGSVLVSGYTNGMAGAQVHFYAERNSNEKPVTAWSSLDIFNGDREGKTEGYATRVSYENVLQFSGVKPGLNTLTFATEVIGKANVDAIQIAPSSGIYSTKAGPVKLKLAGTFRDDSPEIGEATEFEVRVTNRSTRPAKHVVVLVQPESDYLFVDGPVARRIEELNGSATTHFTVGRTRPGKMALTVTAATPIGEEASAKVTAEVSQAGGSPPPWPIALLITAFAAAAAWLVRRHTRQEASK